MCSKNPEAAQPLPQRSCLFSGKASICWLGPVSPTYHVDIRRTLSTHSSLSLSSLRLGPRVLRMADKLPLRA